MQSSLGKSSRVERHSFPCKAFWRGCPSALVFGFLLGAIGLISLAAWADDNASPPKKRPATPALNLGEGGAEIDPEFASDRRARLQKDDEIYKQIKDNAPMDASEAGAFEKIVNHARNCPLKDLTERARWKVAYADLAGSEAHKSWLRDLIKVKGRLIQVRQLDDVGKWLKGSPKSDLYEGWIQADGDPTMLVCVNFSELPPEFRLGVNMDDRVIFDGYFFKLLSFKSTAVEEYGQSEWKSAPLLIGRSIAMDEMHLRTADGEVDEATRVRLNKDDFNSVIDKRPMASLGENYYEYTAYGLTFLHAHQFSPEVLARHARKEVVYADLIGDLRDRYLRELLHVEGRLVRLRKLASNERLRDTSDIKEIYEGWIYHENEYRHPIVVAFTELPPEITTGELLSYRVSFDGYYFKLMAYPSKEKDATTGKPVWRVAPLLIGVKLQSTETEASMWALSSSFVPLVIAGFGLLLGAVIVLTVWFRRADRRTRMQMEGALVRENPFVEAPAVQPGLAWNRMNEPPSLN